MAKKTSNGTLNIDNILFNCRDILRAARNSGSFFEKRDMMLTMQKSLQQVEMNSYIQLVKSMFTLASTQ